jgi:CDP-6-deoxy-D-xylo-4-hexulose-3-dehydrase
MSGAIGIEQLKKLSGFIHERRLNAEYFISLFSNHPYIQIQKEIGSSSWFGFSLVLKENSPICRSELVKLLAEKNIECRPIVTGNFLKNKEVLKHFDFEVAGSVTNAEYIDVNGLFVGNHQVSIRKEIKYLADVIESYLQTQ